MFRFASSAAALFFRLVIVVSLAGYSLSTVNAAMHPPEAMQVEMDHSTTHGDDHVAMADTDHDGDQHDQVGSKSSQNTCCQDYCGVTAIDSGGAALTHPRVKPVHALLDDALYVGLAPRLHLPPNI